MSIHPGFFTLAKVCFDFRFNMNKFIFEVIFSQASALATAIEESLSKGSQSGEIDWITVSEMLQNSNLTLSPKECHKLWKYIAYAEYICGDLKDGDEYSSGEVGSVDCLMIIATRWGS